MRSHRRASHCPRRGIHVEGIASVHERMHRMARTKTHWRRMLHKWSTRRAVYQLLLPAASGHLWLSWCTAASMSVGSRQRGKQRRCKACVAVLSFTVRKTDPSITARTRQALDRRRPLHRWVCSRLHRPLWQILSRCSLACGCSRVASMQQIIM